MTAPPEPPRRQSVRRTHLKRIAALIVFVSMALWSTNGLDAGSLSGTASAAIPVPSRLAPVPRSTQPSAASEPVPGVRLDVAARPDALIGSRFEATTGPKALVGAVRGSGKRTGDGTAKDAVRGGARSADGDRPSGSAGLIAVLLMICALVGRRGGHRIR